MGLLMIIAGLLLIGIALLVKKDIAKDKREQMVAAASENRKIVELEEHLDRIYLKTDEILLKLNASFPLQMQETRLSTEHAEIKDAYERGVTVKELAKQYERGEGEIQLILSLRR